MVQLRDRVFSLAVQEFWRTRESQAASQRQRGVADQGFRSAVTGGAQMYGFTRILTQIMAEAGVDPANIHILRAVSQLPGFFRPTKEWDLLVISEERLLAAIELKSQVGPSFGNNFNNRTEEAMGSALDLWTAYREGAFRTSPQPWLGYLLLLEDCPQSRAPVAAREPHFPVFEEFRGASYAQRYELFCRKLVRERHYTAACFMLADRSKADTADNYLEPAPDLSARQFIDQLLRHVARTAS